MIMKRLVFAFVALISLLLSSCDGTEKINSGEIVGLWEVTRYRGYEICNGERTEWDEPADGENGERGRMTVGEDGTLDVYMYDSQWYLYGSGQWTLDGDIFTAEIQEAGFVETKVMKIIRMERTEMDLECSESTPDGEFYEVMTFRKI